MATHLRRDTVGWVRFFNEVKKRNPAKPRIRKMLGYVICASLDKLTQPTFLSRLKCVATEFNQTTSLLIDPEKAGIISNAFGLCQIMGDDGDCVAVHVNF